MNEMYDHVIHVVKGTLVYNKCFMKLVLKAMNCSYKAHCLNFELKHIRTNANVFTMDG